MRIIRLAGILALLAAVTALSGCASKFKTYNGPEVTQLYVFKEQRKLYLMSGPETLKIYDVGLGFAPSGDKYFEGDGRTPEGAYFIDRRNPNSSFHLSIGISYPNARDVTAARAAGKSPGGDIFIHGRGLGWRASGRRDGDWTAGCISVTDGEIEDIYAMVKNGTPITIYP